MSLSRGLAHQQSRKLIQNVDEIRLDLEHRYYRVGAQSLHSLGRVPDSERLRIERVVHFIPQEGHGDSRTRQRTRAEWRDDRLAVPVLQIVEIDFVTALGDVA